MTNRYIPEDEPLPPGLSESLNVRAADVWKIASADAWSSAGRQAITVRKQLGLSGWYQPLQAGDVVKAGDKIAVRIEPI